MILDVSRALQEGAPDRFLGYFAKRRLPDYFAERGIRWFSDYQPLAGWKRGITWRGNVPARRLVPRRYWRIDQDAAYVIWQVLSPNAAFELLGADGPAVRARYSELAVAADIHGRFPVVLAAEFTAREGEVVVRSIVEETSMTVRHVLATLEERAAIGLTEGTVFPEHPLDLEVRPGLHLLGYDLIESADRDRASSAVTLFWVRRDAVADDSPLHLCSRRGEKSQRVGVCHGTAPFPTWPANQVITETVVLEGVDLELDVDGTTLR